MRRLLSLLVMLTLTCCTPSAQAAAATQPAPATLGPVIEQFIGALKSADTEGVMQLVGLAQVRTFGSTADSDARQMAEMFGASALLSSRVFADVPQQLATDISQDIATNDVPVATKRRMTPADPTEANATAARLIRQTLKPQPGESVGVLVFYQSPVLDSAADGRVLLVLVKIKLSDSEPAIASIVFGDPLTGL